jgi:hypothetical protein
MKNTLNTILILSIAAGAANAGFTSFVIRNGTSGAPGILSNSSYGVPATEFVIGENGMKAGWGSNDINGQTIGDIASLQITRHDDLTRFTAGSGPAVAPYFNLWVTDGGGNYAVIANEPSNAAFQSLFTLNGDGSRSYDLSYTDLSDKVAKVYETPGWDSGTSWVHAMFGSTLTFADIASLEIAPPPPSYIADAMNGVGSGAPDEIGTNIAYGFNWVFGDTLSNYVSGTEGYVVSGASVPAPGSAALLAMSGIIASRRRRS